jgi:hypothetical protein
VANAVYPLYKQALLSGGTNTNMSSGTVKAALVDAGVYTYSAAHEFLTSLTGVVGTAQTLGTKTFTSGVFDAADVIYTAVSGSSAEAIVLYIDTGVAGTSRLVAYLDTGFTGLPVTPNGSDISITWSASGVFAL